MRILLLAVDFAPDAIGIAPYNTGLAAHFVACGHDVTVLTTFPHYPEYRWKTKPALRTATEVVEGVTVRRAWSLLPRQPQAAWRIAFDTSFAIAMWLNTRGLPRQDVVLAIFPPAQGAIAAAALARRWGSRLVVHVQDLPVQAAIAVGMLRAGRTANVGRQVEQIALRSADAIVVIDQSFATHLYELGLGSVPTTVIPNWIDLDAMKPTAPDPKARAQLGATNSQFLVLHAGNVGRKQALAFAARALAPLGDRVRLSVMGAGSQLEELSAMARNSGISNFTLLPLQPAADLARLLSAADALLLSQRREVVDSVVPSKLLTYMASERPVIAAVHPTSSAARIVRHAECGVLVEPEDGDALAAAVDDLASDHERCRRLGRNGREYAAEHFEKSAVLARWGAVMGDA